MVIFISCFQIAIQTAKIAAKGGFNLISIDKNIWKLLNDAPTASTVKIFFYIALNQPDDGIHGYITTKIQLIVDLHSSQTSIFRDLKWLKSNLLIHELKQVDDFEFMANPRFVMNNCDFQTRMDEWRRRQRLDIQRELRLKQQRRLRKFRNSKKQ